MRELHKAKDEAISWIKSLDFKFMHNMIQSLYFTNFTVTKNLFMLFQSNFNIVNIYLLACTNIPCDNNNKGSTKYFAKSTEETQDSENSENQCIIIFI